MTFVEGSEEANPINENYKNFGGLVNEVLQFGFNDGPQVNRKRIEAWLNEAQYQIAREVEGPEYQETETLVLEQGIYKYPLPPDFLRTQDIYYPNLLLRLKMCDLQQFDQTGEIFGPPGMYTLYANELWLFPTPNEQGDKLEHRYIRNAVQMTSETDVPLLNPNYWHLLVEYAVSKAFRAEDDLEMAAAHRTLYKEDLDAYATDVQQRFADRPHIISGTWAEGSSGGWY